MMQSQKFILAGKAVKYTALALALALIVSGCKSTKRSSISTNGGKSLVQLSSAELGSVLSDLDQRYAKSPKNRSIALSYGVALRLSGRTDQSVAVLRNVAIAHPKDRTIQSEFGKSLAAAGQLEQALRVIRQTQTAERPDWKLLSAEGAILDQLGRHQQSRSLYLLALQVSKGEPSVLNNFGMSFILTNDLTQAENYLRQAAQHPRAGSRVRQNLALVLGLQGKFSEAERIATMELSPQEAKANMVYLRNMLAQRDNWNKLKNKKSS